jgi:integrase
MGWRTISPLAGRMTVREACDEYIEYLYAERKTAEESEGRLAKHVYPVLGDKRVAELTTPDVERCKRGMVRKDPQNSDVERASKDSANRVLAMLRAALNRAFEDERNGIPSDAAWRRVKQFRGVGRARQVHLDVNESVKLIGLCDGAFRNLVTATLITGARAPHELAQRFVRDFSYSLGTLSVFDGKTGSRDIVLTLEGIEFFRQITDGRDGSEILLPKDDGTLWGKNHHIKLMKRAVKAAGLPTKCTIYSLRHTYASQSILAGMNLKLLAENMGTSIRMLEVHYGKFIAASRQKLVEQSAFKLGLATLAKHQATAA